MSDEIAIRQIQHFLYCRHRWGLMEIGKVWAENYFVTRSVLMHDRVHNPENSYLSRGKRVFTSVWVYNDCPEYNIYGVTDCIEATPDPDGACIGGERCRLSIVEYKPTKPKHAEYNFDDLMQVYAQKLCVDYVFGCSSEAFLYYADVKKRIRLPIDERRAELDACLREALDEMRKYLAMGVIPPIDKGQKCGGCSLKDLCMPQKKKFSSVREQIEEIGEADSFEGEN